MSLWVNVIFAPSLSLTEGFPRVDGLRSDVQSTVCAARFEIVGGCKSIHRCNGRIILTVPQMVVKANSDSDRYLHGGTGPN